MPRDGSGVYIQPHPPVEAGKIIESLKYNGNVDDIELDLNTPRPIIAGGTGANNADAALVALGGEKAGQVVVNYNSHAFVAGSFRSAPGVTAAPNSTSYFVGFVADYNGSSMVIVAYDGTTGIAYVRIKSFTDGTWGAWLTGPKTTISVAAPSGGADGDVWYQVVV